MIAHFPQDKKQQFFLQHQWIPKGSVLTSGCPFWWREWYCDSVGYDSRASTRCGLVWCFGFLELFEPGGSVVLVVGGEIGDFRKI